MTVIEAVGALVVEVRLHLNFSIFLNTATIPPPPVSTFKLLGTKDMMMLGVLIAYTGSTIFCCLGDVSKEEPLHSHAPPPPHPGLELSFWSGKYPTVIGGTLSPGPSLPNDFNAKKIGISGIIVGCAEIIGGQLGG